MNWKATGGGAPCASERQLLTLVFFSGTWVPVEAAVSRRCLTFGCLALLYSCLTVGVVTFVVLCFCQVSDVASGLSPNSRVRLADPDPSLFTCKTRRLAIYSSYTLQVLVMCHEAVLLSKTSWCCSGWSCTLLDLESRCSSKWHSLSLHWFEVLIPLHTFNTCNVFFLFF